MQGTCTVGYGGDDDLYYSIQTYSCIVITLINFMHMLYAVS